MNNEQIVLGQAELTRHEQNFQRFRNEIRYLHGKLFVIPVVACRWVECIFRFMVGIPIRSCATLALLSGIDPFLEQFHVYINDPQILEAAITQMQSV